MRPIIKKLDIFMLKQFMLLFAGTFFISLFVLMMQFLWRYVDELIGKGLSIEVLAQFFWYMGQMLVPQALPLAILLSSLITLGNIGESSELTAIKAAGIPLVKALRSLFFVSVFIAVGSFVFQNNIGPKANIQLKQLLLSMKQKSPELEIPEEIFYGGIPNCNLYVQRKDMETGMLYGVMIYRMTESFEDAAIILADSGKLQSTAEKQHLLLTLYNGEWFENMRSQEITSTANVPYRRESFIQKYILLDFDNGFNLAEASGIAQMAASQSISQLITRIDSVKNTGDSVGRAVARDMTNSHFSIPAIDKADSIKAMDKVEKGTLSYDSIYNSLTPERQRQLLQMMGNSIRMTGADLEFKAMLADDYNQREREYKIELINKFTLSLTCIIFFFIGASLGAIIRKGGLGVPVIISVLVFIVFYLLDNTGSRMARQGLWAIWFGKGLAPAVLIPLAAFITYKANQDSAVFNMDAYRIFFMRLLGMRMKRSMVAKEVIINDPNYQQNAERLNMISGQIERYIKDKRLTRLANPVQVFFKYQPDHEIEQMSGQLEEVIEELSNSRDRQIMSCLSQYPVVSEKAHTRPFDHKWMNITAALIMPVGIILYIRMWRFRLRLYNDLKQILRLNAQITSHILNKM
ncbi:MAG: LptF/LptG family permease [Prevotellaceae bacterium]|nr:LptF/LptG family permease [Prevotellaceae bacterium]MDO4932789.1 LptF/LptG family permease [Prevotellaceae bacterium]